MLEQVTLLRINPFFLPVVARTWWMLSGCCQIPCGQCLSVGSSHTSAMMWLSSQLSAWISVISILGFDVCAQTVISCSQTLFYLFIFDHFRHRLEGSSFSFHLISLPATRMEMELCSCTACIYNIAEFIPTWSLRFWKIERQTKAHAARAGEWWGCRHGCVFQHFTHSRVPTLYKSQCLSVPHSWAHGFSSFCMLFFLPLPSWCCPHPFILHYTSVLPVPGLLTPPKLTKALYTSEISN